MAIVKILRNVFGEMQAEGIAHGVPEFATGAEAAKLSGLDWQMVDLPLAAMPENDEASAYAGLVANDVFGRWKMVDGKKPCDKDFIGTIGRRTYQLPNSKVLGVFDELLAQEKAKWVSVGSFGNGDKVWGQVEIVDEKLTAEIRPDDFLQWKPTALNFNNGKGSAGIGGCVTRIVCQNTFRMAYGADTMVKLRHSANVVQKFDTLAAIFKGSAGFDGIVERCRFLASQKNITAEKLRKYITEVFGMKVNEDTKELSPQSVKKIAEITRKFESGAGNVGQSWWDAINAITEQLTYSEGRTVENRMESLWFGTGASKADRAFELALEMAV